MNGQRKIWYIHTMKYYSASLKIKKTLLYVITWMNLEAIMLSKKSQTQNDTHVLQDFIYLRIQSS